MANKRKVVVLSEDALTESDMEYLKTLPNFKKYIGGGTHIQNFYSIFPTITYPCHTSIITGNYPDKHGVFSNDKFIAGQKADWNWYADNIKCHDIFTAAKKSGLSTASVFWPVTGNHKHIDYLINEIWARDEKDTSAAAFLRSGTTKELFDEVVSKHIVGLIDRKHPECDTFIVACAADIILRYQPDLMMVHPAQIDAFKHLYGNDDKKVMTAIEEADKHIGMLGSALEKSGNLSMTDFILLSDHGARDFLFVVSVNAAFIEQRLIKIKDGKLIDYDAFCQFQGNAGYIYIKNETVALNKKVRNILEELKNQGLLKRIFDKDKIKKERLSNGGFSFVVESPEFTVLSDSLNDNRLFYPANPSDCMEKSRRGTHGYYALDGPNPVFYAKGSSFKKTTINSASIIDVAPTIAQILGINLNNTDGKSILKNN